MQDIHAGIAEGVRRQAGSHDLLFEGGSGGGHQQFRQNAQGIGCVRIGDLSVAIIQAQVVLVGDILVLIRRILLFQLDLAGKGLLRRHFRQIGAPVKMRQIVFVDQFQRRVQIHVAIDYDFGVGGMVILLVEGDELVVIQLEDGIRVSSAFKAVGGVRKLRLLAMPEDDGVHRRESSLHLVIDHASHLQFVIRGVQFIVPAFLVQDIGLLIDFGEEHRVQVNPGEVQEILVVGAAHRIHGHVRGGHGVDEGVHGAFDQLHEGGLSREVFGAVEHRVFQDVRASGVVFGDGLESHAKHLVAVVAGQMQQLRAALFVFINRGDGLYLFDLPAAFPDEAMCYGLLCHFLSS